MACLRVSRPNKNRNFRIFVMLLVVGFFKQQKYKIIYKHCIRSGSLFVFFRSLLLHYCCMSAVNCASGFQVLSFQNTYCEQQKAFSLGNTFLHKFRRFSEFYPGVDFSIVFFCLQARYG